MSIANGSSKSSDRTCFAMVPARALDIPGISDGMLAVLVLLSASADKAGWSKETVVSMAKRRGCSRQALSKQLAKLESEGLAASEHRTLTNGGHAPTAWRVLYDYGIAQPDVAPLATSGVAPLATSGVAPLATNVSTPGCTPTVLLTDTEEEQVQDMSFDEFWILYPTRKGRKLERGKAEKVWRALSVAKKNAAMIGVANYAKGCGDYAKDAFRWLRDSCWDDWLEPERGTAVMKNFFEEVDKHERERGSRNHRGAGNGLRDQG